MGSNYQAQLRHNRRCLSCNLDNYKFESYRHSTVVVKDSNIILRFCGDNLGRKVLGGRGGTINFEGIFSFYGF